MPMTPTIIGIVSYLTPTLIPVHLNLQPISDPEGDVLTIN